MRSLLVGCGALIGWMLLAELALRQSALGRQPQTQHPAAQEPAAQSRPAQPAPGPKDASIGEYWQERAKQVKAGMTRREVQQLLPPYTPGKGERGNREYRGGGSFYSGSRQVNFYYVAPGWEVRATYDYTGVLRDVDGKTISGSEVQYANVLLGPVSIQWKPLKRWPTYVRPDLD